MLVIPPAVPSAQKPIHGFIEPMPTAKLKQLFPRDGSFDLRTGEPPRFTVFAPAEPRAPRRVIGWAFWTIDVLPAMLGYDGHIHMLIGMDTAQRLTGVIMDLNTEPYGPVSINRPEFAAQFKGKSIWDPFVVRRDIDFVSRATISVRAAAETARRSLRCTS